MFSHFILNLVALLSVASAVQGSAAANSTKTPYQLRVTALVPDENNNTKMQCWQFDSMFELFPAQPGTAIVNLANFINGTYTVVPPHSFLGQHNAPYYQLVAFLSGEVHVTLPNYTYSHIVRGGKNGLLVANDPHTSGHITTFPSDEQTVVMQIAFPKQAPDGAPAHKVRHDGPCKSKEQIIYR